MDYSEPWAVGLPLYSYSFQTLWVCLCVVWIKNSLQRIYWLIPKWSANARIVPGCHCAFWWRFWFYYSVLETLKILLVFLLHLVDMVVYFQRLEKKLQKSPQNLWISAMLSFPPSVLYLQRWNDILSWREKASGFFACQTSIIMAKYLSLCLFRNLRMSFACLKSTCSWALK